jgi:putative phosphoesterase
MQILVISDTHLTDPNDFPATLVEVAHSSDLIIHAGDFVSTDIFEFLTGLGPVEAVRGNCDEPALRGRLPLKKVVDVDGVKIGIIHGSGAPFGMARRVAAEFQDVNAVVYGHAHKPAKDIIGGVLVINPGSPTSNRFQNRDTYAMLTTNGDTITGEILDVPSTKHSS